MGSARVRVTARTRMMVIAGLSCGLLAACGDSATDSGSPAEPPGGEDPTFVDLFGSVLVRADGSQVGIQAVQTRSLVGVYFAASSCPACAGFTPTLLSAYNEMRAESKSFEVVLVSTGPSSEDMFAYMQQSGMPWLAVPYERGKILELANRYAVEWIPTLVVIDSRRKTVTKTGREDIVAKGAAAFDAWLAASVGP